MSSGVNPAVRLADEQDPASVSPQTASARLALLDALTYTLPATDAGVVHDVQWTTYPFPAGNYGFGNNLNPRPSVRMDFSGRAPVVRDMLLSFTLRTLYPPGGSASISLAQPYNAMRYSLLESVMQLDEHIHDLFDEIIIRHPSGQEIYRERKVYMVSRLLRIANAPNPPVRWALAPQSAVGAFSGWNLYTTGYSAYEALGTVATGFQYRQPAAMRMVRQPIDPLGEEVYEGMNVGAWIDGMRAMFHSGYQPLPGPAGQIASEAQRGREFKIRVPARCFDGAPIWPSCLGGLLIDFQFSPPGRCFKPTTPRMCYELNGTPDDYLFINPMAMPVASGVEWGYQINNPQIELKTMRLSAQMTQAITAAAETSGLPISWTQVSSSVAPVPVGATSLLTVLPVQVSNLVGVMSVTYSTGQEADWRQRLSFMNVWNTFSARIGTATIPPGAPYTGPAMARHLLRSWFPLPRGAKGYLTPVDWEGSMELKINLHYIGVQANLQAFGSLSRYNPRNFMWALDFRNVPGVPLTGLSTLAGNLTLIFGRVTAAFPTQVRFQWGASTSTSGALVRIPVSAFTEPGQQVHDVFNASRGRPFVYEPRVYEHLQLFNNRAEDFFYPLCRGDTTAAGALSIYRNETQLPTGYVLQAGSGVTDATNDMTIQLATGAATTASGAPPAAFHIAHPGASTDLVVETFAFFTRLVFFGTAGITVRE